MDEVLNYCNMLNYFFCIIKQIKIFLHVITILQCYNVTMFFTINFSILYTFELNWAGHQQPTLSSSSARFVWANWAKSLLSSLQVKSEVARRQLALLTALQRSRMVLWIVYLCSPLTVSLSGLLDLDFLYYFCCNGLVYLSSSRLWVLLM